ncbi:hypothetical protein EW146_g5641 [Bondarzewia mesenterica]|uniref:Uncharacterized protein n=1 Tax=Bondarzewia mesenterica TaxID=1095465 RepID=A0A4S4LSR2_9AGAM|nr:hypothetical protein EW146_g5641 [Bondarzewia mesenterica]
MYHATSDESWSFAIPSFVVPSNSGNFSATLIVTFSKADQFHVPCPELFTYLGHVGADHEIARIGLPRHGLGTC